MAKVTGPLLSVSARGTIASTQTYSSWRGVNYVRQRVIPSNPRTMEQQKTRNVFANMGKVWAFGPALLRDPWDIYCIGKPKTGRNAFIGENVRVLRSELDMTKFVGSIGARGGIPLESVTASPTANPGEVKVTPVLPTLPTGWVIFSVVAVAIPDQAPTDPFSGIIIGGENETTPYEVTLTGLPSNELVVISAWPVFTRPDGKKAYGPSVNTTVTPV